MMQGLSVRPLVSIRCEELEQTAGTLQSFHTAGSSQEIVLLGWKQAPSRPVSCGVSEVDCISIST